MEPVCRSWIFLAPANPSWSNILNHLTPFAPLSETNCPLARSILPSRADLSPATSHRSRNTGTKKSKAQADTPQRRKIATGVTGVGNCSTLQERDGNRLCCLQRGVLAVKLPTFLLSCSRVSAVASTGQGSCVGTEESKNTISIYCTRFEI